MNEPTNKDFLSNLKLLWASMLEYGVVFNDLQGQRSLESECYHAWNQYGGNFEGQKPSDILPSDLGPNIDWDLSGVPEFMQMSEFVGTDSPSDRIDCLVGELKLKDGRYYYIGTNHVTDAMTAVHTQLKLQEDDPAPSLVLKWNL